MEPVEPRKPSVMIERWSTPKIELALRASMSTSGTCSGKKVFMIERRKVVTHDNCPSPPVANYEELDGESLLGGVDHLWVQLHALMISGFQAWRRCNLH